MYTNKENSTKLIRISPSVKKRLEIFQAGDTPNLCIDRMITFFEITGYNPRYASKNPTALVEKRIEDLVKIVKSQERDIFKPILEKMSNMNSGLQDAPDYVNPEKPDVPLNKNDAFQKVQKRRVQEKR